MIKDKKIMVNEKILLEIKKYTGRESGITIITLVVTIVIILILAGITISTVFGDNGIIAKAREAAEKTEQATTNEQVSMSELGDYIDNIVNGTKGNGEDSEKNKIKVGDYIHYVPDKASKYTKLNEDNTGATENTNSIVQDNLTWQVLRKYDDGRLDIIGSPTSQTIYFNGALGYNNGVYLMNDICESLYSRGNMKARSVNYGDFEYWITDNGKTIRDNYTHSGVRYGTSKTYQTNFNTYPNIYAYENGSGINVTTTKQNGIKEYEEKPTEWTTMPTSVTTSQADTSGLTTTQTYWFAEISETNFGEGAKALNATENYWIASRCVDSNNTTNGDEFAEFDLRIMRNGLNACNIITSMGISYTNNFVLRPVVTLNADVKIEICTGENSIDNMHIITSY